MWLRLSCTKLRTTRLLAQEILPFWLSSSPQSIQSKQKEKKIERAGMWQTAAAAADFGWISTYTYRLFFSFSRLWVLSFIKAVVIVYRGASFAVLCQKNKSRSQSSRRDIMKWYIMIWATLHHHDFRQHFVISLCITPTYVLFYQPCELASCACEGVKFHRRYVFGA